MNEKTKELVNKDPWRLKFHIMPETGWLNDPNGAIQFNGTYHLYYQYVPETPLGGATHWGHVTSEDLVHFKQQEIFMSPTESYDMDGVYSGSGIEKDRMLHFFYTGNVKNKGDYDYIYSGREQNVVHVVSPDGFHIDKREVVIAHEEFPEGFSDHIRDPKVFEKDGKYYMILGARTSENTGSILVYESSDLSGWSYLGNYLEGAEDEGYMWECPDTFELDDKAVLVLSPQGILPNAYQFNNPHAAGYLIGDVDWDSVRFNPETDFQEFDRGFDFYAPHTFLDAKGRRIMWVWMGIGDTMPEYTNPTIARGWQHAMALPRELVIEEGKLFQRPLVEYQQLRQNEVSVDLQDANQLHGEVYELFITFDESESFDLLLRQDTQLNYDGQVLTLKHGASGYGRRKRQTKIEQITSLQIFVDTSSIEIFVNNGEYVLSTRVYPEPGADQIKIQSASTGTVTYWDLKSSKVEEK